MAMREYRGPPIDATMQSIKERRHKGENVAGSSEDDLHSESTDALPSFVDPDEFDDSELEMLRKKILYPDLDLKDLAEMCSFQYSQLSYFLSEFRRRNEQELRDAGLYDTLLPPSRRSDDVDATEEQQAIERERERVREFWRQNPDADAEEVRSETGVELLSDNAIYGCKSMLSAEPARPDEGDESGEDQHPLLEEVESLRAEIGQLRTELERVESNGASSDDASVVELDADTLFTIATGGELDEAQRRAVFEMVVGRE